MRFAPITQGAGTDWDRGPYDSQGINDRLPSGRRIGCAAVLPLSGPERLGDGVSGGQGVPGGPRGGSESGHHPPVCVRQHWTGAPSAPDWQGSGHAARGGACEASGPAVWRRRPRARADVSRASLRINRRERSADAESCGPKAQAFWDQAKIRAGVAARPTGSRPEAAASYASRSGRTARRDRESLMGAEEGRCGGGARFAEDGAVVR